MFVSSMYSNLFIGTSTVFLSMVVVADVSSLVFLVLVVDAKTHFFG